MGLKDWLQGKGESSRDSSPGVTEVSPPVDESMIWICEKCGMKLGDGGDDNPSRRLQKEIKRMLSDMSRKKKVRAMLTSCINICPKEKFAACIVHFGRDRPSTRFYELEPAGDMETMAKQLLTKLDG